MWQSVVAIALVLLAADLTAAWNQTHFRPRRSPAEAAWGTATEGPMRLRREAIQSLTEYVVTDTSRQWNWTEIAQLVARQGPTCDLMSVTQAAASTIFAFYCAQPPRNVSDLLGSASVDTLIMEPNHVMTAVGTMTSGSQLGAPWHLAVLDCTSGPCNDGAYRYLATETTPMYIIDTGVRATHNEFGGRAAGVANTIDGSGSDDCHGHGTHVTGLAIGSTYGVAKGGTVEMIKALDCNGLGSVFSVASGISFVQDQCAALSPPTAIVLSMSLSGPASTTLDAAVASLQASCHASVIVAAGNQNDNACFYSPGRVATCLTVGATTPTDARAAYSNWGSCVDLLAPGGDAGANPITSSWYTSDSATMSMSGTSMATPLVAGFAGLIQRQYLATGYVLGSTNLGLLVNDVIKARLRGGQDLFTYFTVDASAPTPAPPQSFPPVAPPPAPPGDQATDAVLPPPGMGALAMACLLMLFLA